MNKRTNWRVFVSVIVAVLIIGAVVVTVFLSNEGDNWATIASLIILVLIAIVAIITIRKALKESKSGFPKDDERSLSIKMRAGYFAFYISMYFVLGMGFVYAAFEDNQILTLPTAELLMIIVAIMGFIFLVLNSYFNKKSVAR